MSNQEDQDPFWLDDYSILFDRHRLVEFVPTEDMTIVEKFNAVTRFMVYLGVLLTLIYGSINMMYIPLITGFVIYLTHEHYPDILEQKGGDPTVQEVQMPTQDNPFMNVLMTDYTNNPQRKPAGDIEISAVNEEVEKNFNHGLYKDVDDIWGKNNSQRQFYTNPATTIPNDRDSFMKWCYSTPYTCKDGNLSRCLRYEDVRAHGQIG